MKSIKMLAIALSRSRQDVRAGTIGRSPRSSSIGYLHAVSAEWRGFLERTDVDQNARTKSLASSEV